MIIVRLLGGLGNQLFQYAAARRLAIVNGAPLKLDISAFATYALRKYELDSFSIQAEVASPAEIAALRAPRFARALSRVLRRPCAGTHVDERRFQFDPRVLDVRAPAYLTGYWQSERYFVDITQPLRSDLTLKQPVSAATAAVDQVIRRVDSVSLHVRRGDYVTSARTSRTHGTCPPEYYRAALAEIRRRTPRAHIFVFSDDTQWVKDHLRIKAPFQCVDHNGPDRAHEDLYLMSRCRHHIIANSTFSWWGAWLATSKDQVVVAPRRWFASRNSRSRDVYPNNWLRV